MSGGCFARPTALIVASADSTHDCGEPETERAQVVHRATRAPADPGRQVSRYSKNDELCRALFVFNWPERSLFFVKEAVPSEPYRSPSCERMCRSATMRRRRIRLSFGACCLSRELD